DGRLAVELVRHSKLHLIAIDPDAKKVQAARAQFIAAGLHGERLAVHTGTPETLSLPPYLASLIVCTELPTAGTVEDTLKKLYPSVRTYGGTCCFPAPTNKLRALAVEKFSQGLAQAKWSAADDLVLLKREGALPGAANWTHEHADESNTRVSKDQLVKAPLGVLWFGGPSHDAILPRHGHGPQPQVIDGRLIIEGVDLIRAMDIYTGRLLWETRLPGVGAFYNNLAHQPGANAAGTNFTSGPDGI